MLTEVTSGSTTKFGYDANGSLTTRKNGSDALLFRQGYDLKNRLVEADADGDADADLRLAYDHQEGRVARHTLDGTGAVTASDHYLLDRMNPTGYEQVLEQAASLDAAPTRSFLLGHNLILQADGSTKRSFLFDGHGTNRGLVDATGRLASAQVLAFDAFGVRTDAHSSVLTPIQYTGQWFDDILGQGYHRHRYLAHASGTWNTDDVWEGGATRPLTLHKRLYAHGNPVSGTDPTGRFSLTEIQVTQAIQAGIQSYRASRLIKTYNYVHNLIDTLLFIRDIANAFTSVPQIQQHFRNLASEFRIMPSLGENEKLFNMTSKHLVDVALELFSPRHFDAILRAMLRTHSKRFREAIGSLGQAGADRLVIYLPSLIQVGGVSDHITKVPAKVGRFRLAVATPIVGGGRLFGLGFTDGPRLNDHYQFFRVDWHGDGTSKAHKGPNVGYFRAGDPIPPNLAIAPRFHWHVPSVSEATS